MKALSLKDLYKDFKDAENILKEKGGILLAVDGKEKFGGIIGKISKEAKSTDELIIKDMDEKSVLNAARESDVCLLGLTDEKIPASLKKLTAQLEQENIPYVVFIDLKKIERLSNILKEAGELAGLKIGDVVVISTNPDVNLDELAKAVVRELTEMKKPAIGRTFPFFRRAVAMDIVSRTAKQNGLAATIIISGANFPVLTGNQVKMLLELAAVFDHKLDERRIKELLAVVGAGYSFRSIARSAILLLPGPHIIVKGLVSYLGTLAIGKAAIQYFESEKLEKIRERPVI